jgi:hypothetical protein
MIPLQEILLPLHVAETLAEGTKAYRMGDCGIFVSREPLDLVFPRRWHLSISCERRYPTWEEIGQARDRLLPDDVFMCVPFPPRAHWLSIHPNCFHLWQFRDDNLEAQMKLEGEQAREAGKGEPQPEFKG